MTPLREAVIDLGAIRHNVLELSVRVQPAALMVVIKADAYGHGAPVIAQTAVDAGIRFLGTLDLTTALALRSAGIDHSVDILTWQYGPFEQFREAIDAGITLGVSRQSELDRIEAAGSAEVASLHLKIDTGLNRNGATATDWPALVGRALELQAAGIARVSGVFTHIAEASDEEDDLAVERFRTAIAEAERLGARFAVRHLAASSAGFRRDDVRFDMVRMGGHVWGIPSFDGITPAEMNLRPALTLSATVTAVEPDGTGASIVQIPLGYADGIPRNVSGVVEVAVGGIRYPLESGIGHSSFTLRVDAPVAVGDTAVLFGPGDAGEQTVREWGDLSGTLGDEIVARLGERIVRRYLPA
jgi:alanine racemase